MINKKEKGFTLVELLAVIVILAIVLVIAVPKVMSVIEDSKKATLESTAKMIASAAEKAKVQNTVLGNNDEITCDSVAKINNLDYASCSITFDDNTAKVTIEGKGKFKGLNVCSGTKTSAEATNDSCIMKNGCFEYKVVQKVESFDINKEKCKEMFYGFDTEEQQEMFCSGGIDSISGLTLKDSVNYGEMPLNELILGEVVSNIKYLDKVVAITGYNMSCGLDVVIPNTISNKNVEIIGPNLFYEKGITSVSLPDKLTYISWDAFFRNNIKEITFPDSLEYISDYAFRFNQLENEINFPNGLKYLGFGAFIGNQLEKVIIPPNVNFIGYGCFAKENNSNENLEFIVNKTGKSFNWGEVIDTHFAGDYNFVAGIVDANIDSVYVISEELDPCFRFDFETGTITGYDDSCGINPIVIPEKIGGFAVKSIEKHSLPSGYGRIINNSLYIPNNEETWDNFLGSCSFIESIEGNVINYDSDDC